MKSRIFDLIDSEGTLLVTAEIEDFREGVAIKVIDAKVPHQGNGEKLIRKLLTQYPAIYTGSSPAYPISVDAQKMILRMAKSGQYTITGTGMYTRRSYVGKSKFTTRYGIPEHVRIALRQPEEPETHFRFKSGLGLLIGRAFLNI